MLCGSRLRCQGESLTATLVSEHQRVLQKVPVRYVPGRLAPSRLAGYSGFLCMQAELNAVLVGCIRHDGGSDGLYPQVSCRRVFWRRLTTVGTKPQSAIKLGAEG